MKRFPTFVVLTKSLSKPEIFWSLLNVTEIIRVFCDVTILTKAFYHSLSKNKPMHKI